MSLFGDTWRTVWAFVRRDAAVEATHRGALLAQFSGVIFWSVFFILAARLVDDVSAGTMQRYNANFAAFVLVGIAFGGYLQAGLVSFPQRLREAQLAGTFEATLMSTARAEVSIFGAGVWDHVVTTLRVCAYLLAGALFVGLDLRAANIAGCLVVLALALVAFDSLGLMGAALVLLLRRGVSLAPVIATLAALFSGVYFPLEALPPAAQLAALLLPSTHALYGIRLALLRGAGWSELWQPIAALLCFDVVLVPLALLALRRSLWLALREGTLGHY